MLFEAVLFFFGASTFYQLSSYFNILILSFQVILDFSLFFLAFDFCVCLVTVRLN